MTPQPRLEHRQNATASPRLQHAVRLLQMSSLDYALALRAEVAQNPFLDAGDDLPDDAHDAHDDADIADDPDDGSNPDHEGPSAPSIDDPGIDPGEWSGVESTDIDAERPTTSSEHDDRDSWADVSTNGASNRDGDETGDFDRRAVEASLAEHLHAQLGLLALPERDRTLARSIVESLDDDGYLRTDLEEMVAITALVPPAAADELRIALCRVQSLEPTGVGARTVTECLKLQAEALPDRAVRALALDVVALGLEVLARRDIAAVARSLGRSKVDVEAVFASIRRFDPRPGLRFGRADVRYVAPDVVLRKVRGRWTAQLNDAVVPRLRLHCVYAEMFERQRRRQNVELAQQLRDARWTLRNVEQRFATILGVAQAIVSHQSAFFDHGPLAMKPLALRDIADQVGVHESTVCRVTHDKYIATPSGVYELKYFFSRGMRATSGTEVTGTAIRAAMQHMLDTEICTRPLSDAEIARALARQGVNVTRRTVTKYRHVMKIESAPLRRKESRA